VGEPLALAEPILLELNPAQVARLGRRLSDLAALGFECEVFGGRTFLLRTAPPLPGLLATGEGEALAGLGEADGLVPLLLGLTEEAPGEGEGWRDRLLVQLACRTAVRRGKPLSRPAMRALVDLLGRTRAPAVCPHGSPLLMQVGAAQLERQFRWR
jgi:DNA mismatch repair protein MutL